uniref:E3 ubiquitin-protein ligase CHFR n=1 Tax=Phallusia mammillata TaxID=59560 RepID=A0A6F9DQB5_9ASCI|nr:E3 ubiquitin-protein ligase RING2 [Phallusia mammillata]
MTREIYFERLGASEEQWLSVKPGEKITFGRSVTNRIRLYSEFVSREHAVIEQTNGNIYITDLKSLNGIHVNEVKIKTNIKHQLKVGDKVEIGKPLDCEEWKHLKLCDRFVYEVKEDEVNNLLKRPVMAKVHKSLFSVKQHQERTKMVGIKRKQENVEVASTKPELINILHQPKTEVKLITNNDVSDQDKDVKTQEEKPQHPNGVLLNDNYVAFVKNSTFRKLTRLEKQLEMQREESAKEKQNLEDEFRRRENMLKSELLKYEQLAKENNDTNTKDQLVRKEAELSNLLKEMKEKEKLENEKVAKNEELLRDKEQQLRDEMMKEKVLAQQREKDAAMAAQREAEELAKKHVVGKLEEELQCIICSELFVKSTTLNCSHTFCQFCIDGWLKKKNKVCPVCRAEVTSRNHSLVLDNYIEAAIAEMSPELQERRKMLITERKNAEAALKDPPKPIRKRKRKR